MLNVFIVTLFPDMFSGPFDMSMIAKAQELDLCRINFVDLREFGIGPRRSVDDTPYGGGDGMLLKPEPVVAAIESVKEKYPAAEVIMLTPTGRQYTQKIAKRLSGSKAIILLAGHYEGFDERINKYVDEFISIGDYVLTGGELPAMIIADSVIRLIPGVLGGENSAQDESFSDGLLEYPQYTRPQVFRGEEVPEVLREGNHKKINDWRADQAKQKTRSNRPDLLE
jgi:tRNA (guanine37-N1)-methyltransferase